MEYILLDFENVAFQAIPEHAEIQKVFLFVGEKQTKVSLEIAESMQRLGPKAELIRIKGSGNNALDFHIAFYIGKYSEIEPGGEFKIVSKDKGFDPLVAHLVARKIDCARVETLATKAISKTSLKEMISDLGAHFNGLSEKARPKKENKMKAYIKNRTKQEDAIVNEAFAKLVSDGHIEVVGG
ncbi:MAG: PIN domain-containing protein [Fibrobacteria bacterium]